ncbi:hypothetical protein H9Y04_17375 [Streptomyces sp. TRM66268-LWL]|uniref:Uncharacterized protein n=1 Tax=Streptomyces polyasparticus TaxID=2767826 RepID=A0ABR7SGJ5_9ACTN|nr:hypothetical protein [Streptomyces polyasparticus]MBC9714334.1 hypothetical protein [Streptomyces polyasparticus]
MFKRRARADREWREAQRAGQAMLAMHTEWPEPPVPVSAPAPATPTDAAVVPDFLPPDFRAPSRLDVSGLMMRWLPPLVIDGEVRQCPECGTYRDWIIFNMRDGAVWLRCQAGHHVQEPRLDSAWYNRNSGPVDSYHPNLEDGLRHLGH